MALPLARRFSRIQGFTRLEHEIPFPGRKEDPSRAQDWLQDILARYLDALPIQVQRHLELQIRTTGPPLSLEILFESAEAAFDTLPQPQACSYPATAGGRAENSGSGNAEAYPGEDLPMRSGTSSFAGEPPSACRAAARSAVT
eukprot:GHVS01061615.1.p2 GENE.GHVS01061615.1~~GHVS01061615.1.p2  ORF type:complete len:143 (+),score=4.91 GHVS01061615.1:236-664(+)